MPRDARMVGAGLASGRVALSPTEAIALDYTLRQELKAPKAEGSYHDYPMSSRARRLHCHAPGNVRPWIRSVRPLLAPREPFCQPWAMQEDSHSLIKRAFSAVMLHLGDAVLWPLPKPKEGDFNGCTPRDGTAMPS